jgi:hypothetical protein
VYRSANPTAGSPTFASYFPSATAGNNYYLAIDPSNNIYVGDAFNSIYLELGYSAVPGTGQNIYPSWTNSTGANSAFYDQANQTLWTASAGVVSSLTGYQLYNNTQTAFGLGTNASSIVADSTGNLYLIGSATIQQYPGPFRAGDVSTSNSGYVYVCTTPGMPGTWSGPMNASSLGTAGQVLAVNSGATAPTWVTPSTTTAPPQVAGLKGWTFDFSTYTANTGLGLTAGVGYYQAVYLAAGTVVSNIGVAASAAGTSTTLYLGLYSSTTRLAATSGLATASISTSTYQSQAVTSSYTVTTSGIYWIGLLSVGGTGASIFRNLPTSSLANAGATATANNLTLRASSLGTGLTSLPTSISGTPASLTQILIAGVS